MNFIDFAAGIFRVSAAHATTLMASTELRSDAIAANIIVCAFPAGPASGEAQR